MMKYKENSITPVFKSVTKYDNNAAAVESSHLPRLKRSHNGFALKSHLISFVCLHYKGHLIMGAAHTFILHGARKARERIMLSLLKARRIVDQALRRARELDINISVAVCDGEGRLIALNQMDRSHSWEADRCSMGKAVAAAVTGFSSNRLSEQIQRHAFRPTPYNNVVPPRGQAGGLPIVENGLVEGGCGVSGAINTAQDEECARAGVAAIDQTEMEPCH